ncbi:asparaginase [soil metagenome]
MTVELVPAYVPLAATSRSGFDESVHWGAAVVTAPDGSVVCAVGDPNVIVYPRSALKPVQADAMVTAGLDLEPELLALVGASHDGSPRHIDGVRRILAGVGLDEQALRTTPALPFDRDEATAVLRAGGGPLPVTMNCSGKHAGMLATCVTAGWPTEGHLEAGHPLQRHITTSVGAALGPVAHVGVDGCGAPTHAVSLVGLATGVGRLAAGTGAVYRAMTNHPDMVGGPTRPVTCFIRGVVGLLAKDGAEGVFVAALPDGGALAVKVADGSARAVSPVVLALLPLLGVPAEVLDQMAPSVEQSVLGHGRPVGSVRALIDHTGA